MNSHSFSCLRAPARVGLASALWCVASVGEALAVDLFRVSGRVATADRASAEGAEVDVFLDLNRDGRRQSLETTQTRVNAEGNYRAVLAIDPRTVGLNDLTYVADLASRYREGGFAALLGDSPLVAVVRVELEGHGVVVRRLSVTFDALTADATLTPLAPVSCTLDACASGDGSLRIEGLSRSLGIDRAYAAAGDPVLDRGRFPGAFADSDGALLRSTAFAEIQLRDASGDEIHDLSTPVIVHMAIAPRAWSTLPDLETGNGRVDLPMYTFDRDQGQWVRAANGWLVDADGALVEEDALASIRGGTAEGDYFVAFETDHFSSFNCDEPLDARACVRGRLVGADGEPIAGAQVDLEGANYVGNAGTVTTGPQGDFAGDVLRSEAPGQDHDGNGVRGETFRARVSVARNGYFLGEPFDTPRDEGSALLAARPCLGSACDCAPLGELEVTLEQPRACEVEVQVTVSERDTAADDPGPFGAGEPVRGAAVMGDQVGMGPSPVLDVGTCGNPACAGVTDEAGRYTVLVPVLGDAPTLHLGATFYAQSADRTHYYWGEVEVPGCRSGETRVAATIEAVHATLEPLGAWSFSRTNDSSTDLGCACRAAGERLALAPFATLVALGLAIRRRRRRRGFRD